MSAKSAHLSAFSAETENEAKIRSTSRVNNFNVISHHWRGNDASERQAENDSTLNTAVIERQREIKTWVYLVLEAHVMYKVDREGL